MATDRLSTELVDVLEEAHSLERFAATLAHEAMQPIAAGLMYCELLRKPDLEISAERREAMMVSVEDQLRYLRDLAAFLTSPFEREALIIAEEVRAISARCAAVASGHRLVTHAHSGTATVMTNPVRLESALRNLITNATKYAPLGTTITVTTTIDDGWVVLAVADEGPGIPEHEWERIFEPEVRLAPELTAGSGLGLHVVRLFAEREHGQARIARSDASGTTVAIELPVS
ncbi:MAG: HAMP domain-containing histidine kinase [Thermoleophilaceae bacterium]|nr:HAMP domain-containing histidine kinase [Thermoleophilaceae bacterium]